jgi:hypothetical protein
MKVWERIDEDLKIGRKFLRLIGSREQVQEITLVKMNYLLS